MNMDTHEIPDPIAYQKMWKDKAETIVAFEDAKRRYNELKESARFELKCEIKQKAEELLNNQIWNEWAADFWRELEKII